MSSKPSNALVYRLTFAYLLIFLCAILFLGIATYIGLTRVLERQLDEGLIAIARSEASYATHGDGQSIHIHDNDPISNESGLHHHVQATDLSGSIVARTNNLSDHPLLPDQTALIANGKGESVFRTIDLIGLPHRVLYYPLKHGNQTYSLQVAVSREYTNLVQRGLLKLFAGVGAIALLIAAFSGYWLARRAIDPIRSITATAEHITETNLSQRIPASPVQDELGHLIEVLNRMLERLDKSFESQRRFIADAAHELRSPLTILRGNLDVALRRERSPESYREILSSNLEEVQRLGDLTSRLLTLARDESGQLHLDLQEASIDELIMQVVKPHRDEAEKADITLKLQIPDITLRIDRERIRQVLDNLLDNALRYTPSGQGITIESRQVGDRVEVLFIDQGIGISFDAIDYIFDPFYRTDQARNRESGGVGLGLSICRAIARQHGGEITVDSQLGIGSCFILTLPLENSTVSAM